MKNTKKIDIIIEKFIDEFKKQHSNDSIEIEGVLLAGSYAFPDKLSKNSDLDLFLVIKNAGKRYRGMKKIENIDVDYFINPIQQLRADLEKAKISNSKVFIYVLANGKILLDKDNRLLELQKGARLQIKRQIKNRIPNSSVILMKYFIDDYIGDIEDDYENKDYFAWQYNICLLLNYLVEVFCKYNHILQVKPKYQKAEIIKKDKHFVKLYEKIAIINLKEEKIKQIKKLSRYVLDSLGGGLPEEWEIESPLSL